MSLFDVDEAHFAPIVEAAVGQPVVGSVHLVPVGSDATGTDTTPATVLYTTRDGRFGELSLFVKRCVWKGRSEAVHYRAMAAHGVPVPSLYGVLHNASGQEVLFLERLSAIGFRKDSEVEWRALLSLLARFNACPVTPDYSLHLHPYEQVGRIEENYWVTGIGARPDEDGIAHNLRRCGVGGSDVSRLVQASQTLFRRVAVQPQGLLHQDFLPNNVGWRGEREEMVVFDLHKNALGPRFSDVAPYLCLPDWSDPAGFLEESHNGVTRRDLLIRHYLAEFARIGGPVVSPAAFRQEAADLFWAHQVTALPWLTEGEYPPARIGNVIDRLHQITISDDV